MNPKKHTCGQQEATKQHQLNVIIYTSEAGGRSSAFWAQ